MSGYVSPELERMAKRAALPIGVRFIPQEPAEFGEFRIVGKAQGKLRIKYTRHADLASRAYFALVASLTEPAQASRAATAGVGPASTSAISSPSAAPNPSSVQSVAPGSETPSVLGASNPGAR